LTTIDREVNRGLDALFPSLRLQLDFPMPDLQQYLESAQLRVFEDGYPEGQEISQMGQGARRAVQMAMLRRLAETRSPNHHPQSCRVLLIEEPELHLHPQAVELVRLSLKRLAREGYQVIFATHSAALVTAEDVRTCLLIRKTKERGTYMRERVEDAVRRVIRDAPSQLQLLFSLSNSNEMLFAERIILTEGKTELRILPRLFERLTGESFVLLKMALVRQGGVSNTRKSMQVLTAMDLPTKAVVDLDYAFTDAVRDHFLEANDRDLHHCRDILADLAPHWGIRLVAGMPVTKRSAMSAAEAYSLLARQPEAKLPLQRLHDTLLTKGIWLWQGGSIEDHLGLEGKNEKVWADFVHRLEGEEESRKVIPDLEGVMALCEWLKS